MASVGSVGCGRSVGSNVETRLIASGSREQGAGSGEQGAGSREREVWGDKEDKEEFIPMPHAQCPMPDDARCYNGGSTAVDGFPGIKHVAWNLQGRTGSPMPNAQCPMPNAQFPTTTCVYTYASPLWGNTLDRLLELM